MENPFKWFKKVTRIAPVMAQHSMQHHCLVAGDDRNTHLDKLDSTGEFLLDQINDLCFDVNQDAVRELVKYGEPDFSVPHSILYESSGAPYNFVTGKFDADEQSTAQILKNARSLAQVQAMEQVEQEDSNNRLGLVLTILTFGLSIMCIIVVA